MGKWGADCSNACSSECITCNPINGECKLTRAVMPLLVVVLVITLGMITIYVLVRLMDVEQSENLN
jgi:hypothetical protein